MLSIIRSMSRALNIVLLAVLSVPGALPECQPVSGTQAQGMDCCHKAGAAEASLDVDCCAVTRDTPSPVPSTAPATPTRTVDPSAVVLATAAPAAIAQPSSSLGVVALDTGPPLAPLYLRLSTIRR